MKTIVLGLAPYLDRELYRASDLHVFDDDYAFIREGVLRCFTPNLAAIAVTTCLHDMRCPVEYIDLTLEFGLPLTAGARKRWLERIECYFEKSQPSNVFISCVSATEHLTLKYVSAAIHKVSPKSVIGVGSYHANALREALLEEMPEVDFIFMGDIESSAEELMSHLNNGDLAGLSSMENVLTRQCAALSETHKKPKSNPSASRFSYRICDRYLHFYDSMPVVGMKGCPFRCSFCQEKTVRPGFHQRDPSTIVAETIDNYKIYEEKLGHRRIGYSFMEPIFGFDRKWTEQLLMEIESANMRFYWGVQTRVGQLDGGQIEKMVQHGCRIIFYGLENYSPEMLKRMNKTNGPRKYLRSFSEDLHYCRANGIAVEANILCGYPGETEETLHENEQGIIDMLKRYPNTGINLNLFRPLPGTKGLNEMDFDTDAKLLVPDWWKREIVAGITVLVQPSARVNADKLLRFYRSIYDKANCYNRRGVSDELIRLVSRDELDTDVLCRISESVRQKVWQLTKLSKSKSMASAIGTD